MMFWRKKDKILAAMEIGTSKIVVAVAELKENGTLLLMGVGQSASSGMRKGDVVDFGNVQTAIQGALADAEQKMDATIGEVNLALSGPHIGSRTVRVQVPVEGEEEVITKRDVAALDREVQSQPVPNGQAPFQYLRQHYYTDDGTAVENPAGMNSKTLAAGYHIIHGMQSRLETVVRCVLDLDVEVNEVAFAPYASARVVLSEAQRRQGAVLIDLGAGVTDYIAYAHGVVVHTGVLAVGGDHLSHDLALGLKLPLTRAEQLKIEHGSVELPAAGEPEMLVLERQEHMEEREIHRESMVQILAARQRETLELVRQDLDRAGIWDKVAGGVYITGGASQMRGLKAMARAVFPVPVHLWNQISIEGDQAYARRPDLSVVFGMLQYAAHCERNPAVEKGLMRRLGERVWETFSMLGLF
jgi:cell division protein FtsA